VQKGDCLGESVGVGRRKGYGTGGIKRIDIYYVYMKIA
jgi:hypothetical protein